MNPLRLSDAMVRRLGRALHGTDAELQLLAARFIGRLFGMPAEPTKALPGTEAKLSVMADRVAAGCSPFHPLDLQLGTLPDGVGLVVEHRDWLDVPRVLGMVRLQGEVKG